MVPKILVVDHELTLLNTLQAFLEQAGFVVQTATNGRSALHVFRAFQPDLVVLDIMLPEVDGLEVLRQLRQISDVYVIMLTAKADEADKVIGLGLGADDYVTKPFSPRELVARAKAALRRLGGSVGRDTSLVLNSSGLPVISYYDLLNKNLKLAICNDATCSTATIKVVDSVDEVGEYSSIALNSSDFPVISYYDGTNDALKVAVCNNLTCTQPTRTTVDSLANVGKSTTIALTTDDFPIISYYDDSNNDVKVAICHNIACTNPTLSTIESVGYVGDYSSMALDSSGYPVISYYYAGTGAGDLKLAVFEVATAVPPSGNNVYSPFIVR